MTRSANAHAPFRCCTCKLPLAWDQFDGVQAKDSQCKTCKAVADRERKLLQKYNLTSEQFDAMLEAQGGGCGICGTPLSSDGRSLHVDHDHRCCPGSTTCGKCVRGILCFQCNSSLAVVERFPQEVLKWLGL